MKTMNSYSTQAGLPGGRASAQLCPGSMERWPTQPGQPIVSGIIFAARRIPSCNHSSQKSIQTPYFKQLTGRKSPETTADTNLSAVRGERNPVESGGPPG